MATLQFLGATRQVTGSCYLIESDQGRILLECGMTQENQRRKPTTDKTFLFDPKTIDAVVISHAHIDHSGLLPKLIRDGFHGPVYTTPQTFELMEIMLKDSAFIQQKNAEWKNRRSQRHGEETVEPLYDLDDVEKTLGLIHTVEYGKKTQIHPDVEVCFNDAGHIIGSSIVELWVKDGPHKRKIVFSGDLGNKSDPLLQDPELIKDAHVLLMESTYGDRNHRPLEDTLIEFQQILDEAMEDGGNVFIPAFAVGRTQDLIFHLGRFYQHGTLKQQKVYLDSPMATAVSGIYAHNSQLYNDEHPHFNELIKGGWKKWLPILTFTHNTEESMALNKISGGAIIIAGSGMCTGGRIMHHLKHNLWHKRSHIIFSGFQARGTVGRALVEGAKHVKIMGEEFVVQAQTHTLGGLSAHAGQNELLAWAGQFHDQKPRLYLIHGELEKMLILQNELYERYGWHASIPTVKDKIKL
ncbi:MAG: MBL fold metallo-hydrolase [Gammaproteobacteria bacterium]|nr:MBL fold metallo-hydrolase [Gammaproteobacteria bacterium]